MDERISGQRPEESKFYAHPRQQTSDLLFDQLKEFVQVKGETDQLEHVLKAAKEMRKKEVSKKKQEKPGAKKPGSAALIDTSSQDSLFTQLEEAFENGTMTESELEEFYQELTEKAPPYVNTALIKKLFNLLNTSNLTAQAREDLENNLASLINYEGPSGKLGSVLEQLLVSYQATSLTHLTPSQIQIQILELLSKQANEMPPGPLSESAKELLKALSGANASKIWQSLTNPQNIEKQGQILNDYLSQVRQNPSIMNDFHNGLTLMKAHHHPATLWRQYYSAKASENEILLEIQALMQIISMLKKYSNDPELTIYAEFLLQTERDYPNISQAQLNELNKIIDYVVSSSESLYSNGKLTPSQAQALLQSIKQMLQGVISSNKNNISQYENLLNQLNNELSNVQAAQLDMTYLESLIQDLLHHNMTPSKLNKLMTVLDDLLSRYSNLPTSDQNALASLLQKLSNLTYSYSYEGKNYNINFGSLIGDLQIEIWTQQYFQNNLHPTMSGLMAYLEQMMAKFPHMSGNPFFQNMWNEMNADLAGFPNCAEPGGFMGSFITTTPFGPNGFASNLLALFQESSYSGATGISEAEQNFYNALENSASSIESQISGLNKTISGLNNLNNTLNGALNTVNTYLIFTESLPDAFANAIFGHYLPMEEAYMEELAMILEADNLGTAMNNAILANIADFSSADIHYNFNNWISGQSNGKGQYNTSYTQAGNQVQNEMNQASQDLGNTNAALSAISQKMAAILQAEQSGQISKTKAAALLKELQGDKSQLLQAKQKLIQLYNALKQVLDVDIDDHHGSPVTISQSDLDAVATAESQVQTILTTINDDIGRNGQIWSGQAQTAQMNVQLAMTQMQQAWSVITSSMQMLNQSYLTIAQNISR